MANRLVEMIDRQSARYGCREVYRFCWRGDRDWYSTSWEEFAAQVHNAARALAAMGVEEKDAIAICSPNTPQILITEFGAFENRLAVIPIYSGSSQSQLDFIAENGEAQIIFVGDSNQYPLAYQYWKEHPELKGIVIFRNDGFELRDDDTISIFWDDFMKLGLRDIETLDKRVSARREAGLPEDTATLIYTSGTTGEPKGVVITHRNYDTAMEAHLEVLPMVTDTDLSMAFLPMSHIFEKAWSFFCLTRGIAMAINYDPRVIQETIHDVRPNVMCCVPRFWEKVYAGVREKIEGMNFLQRMMVRRALKVGRRRNIDYVRVGAPVPGMLEREYRFWDKMIFTRLKHAIGIPDPNIFPTAGAALSDKICEFMRSVGIEVTIGYGLSETTATVAFFRQTGYEIGTVGKPLPPVQVRIDPTNNEIQVKGDTVTPGYYKNPEANAAAFTEDGFFRTGDAGYINADGAIVLTERVKDLFKTSNGKYIAPQLIESRLAENKYIDEATIIGDRRKYVTALVVPNLSQLRRWAASHGLGEASDEVLCDDERTNRFVKKQIDALQQDVAEFEKIKRITLLPRHFSLERGEVTNTLKVKRSVVAQNYKDLIDAMYPDD